MGALAALSLCEDVSTKKERRPTHPLPTEARPSAFAEKRSNPVPPHAGRSVISVFSASQKIGRFQSGQQNPRPSSEVLLRQFMLIRFSKSSSVSGQHCTDGGRVTRPGAVGKRAASGEESYERVRKRLRRRVSATAGAARATGGNGI